MIVCTIHVWSNLLCSIIILRLCHWERFIDAYCIMNDNILLEQCNGVYKYFALNIKEYGSTVGSRLSAPRLSVSGHSDVGSRRHFFRSQRKKYVAVTGVLLQEKKKATVRTTFVNATPLFPSSTGISSQFTTSEAANVVVHCIIAWQIKRWGT